ncbi:hypothetical protein HUS22_12435 [Marinobacter lutaoensis]|nr:hypothetical protein [Marinobacter lutaoensis]
MGDVDAQGGGGVPIAEGEQVPRSEENALGRGPVRQRQAVDIAGQRAPDVIATGGRLDVLQADATQGRHGLGAGLAHPVPKPRHVAPVAASDNHFMDHAFDHAGAVHHRQHLDVGQRPDQRPVGGDVAAAEARREGLGKGTHVNHPVEGVQGGQMRRCSGQDVAEGVVLDDRQVMLFGDAQHRMHVLQRHGGAGGVVGHGLDEQQPGPVFADGLLQAGQIQAVRAPGHADGSGPLQAQFAEHGVVAGGFHQHRIADATDRPADVIGMHFFSPANVMRLLEVVEGAATGAATQATAMSLARRLGKVGVLVGNGYGFVGNRILYRRLAEALALVTDGATPARVDRVLTAFGFPMGQFAMSDLAGLDVGYRAREERRRAGDTVPRTWLDLLVEQGRLGQKTGAGVYRYEPGDRTPREDVEVLRLIERFRAEQGVTVRAVSDEEIQQRCLYVMVNEAFRILDEGIARRPVDIDVIWNCGYGFPAHKGGLMYWAEREGLATIQARLLDFHDQTGEAHWRPADGLNRRLAEAGAGGERP